MAIDKREAVNTPLLCTLLALALSISGCWGSGGSGDAPDGSDADSDTDSDTDTDSDADTDDDNCYVGDFTISSAADVATLAPYDCVSGSLTISASELGDFSLPNLVWVGKYLTVDENDVLVDLNGLDHLISVGCRTNIFNNDSLTNLDGLSGLTALENKNCPNYSLTFDPPVMFIGYNPALTTLDGLGNITSVKGQLSIHDNVGLPQCEACDLLDHIVVTEIVEWYVFFNNQPDSCSDTCE